MDPRYDETSDSGAPPEETREGAGAKPVADRRIGPYKVLKELGHGGMGSVYLAARADEQYQKRVAIKVIKAGMDGDEAVRHFRRERQILAGLDHPNIARLLDGGATDDGLPYLVMEYIQGQPLHEYCDSHRLTIDERLGIFQQVCSAVAYAHRNLIVHRDLKPGNIVVTAEGLPRLLDFGIAKLLNPELAGEAGTATGLAMTPEYASPEQARGAPITTASDVYSLGVILYELLTGQRPYHFASRNPLEVLRAVVEQEPPKPSTAVERLRLKAVLGPQGDASVPLTAEGASRTREGTPVRLQRKLRGDLDNIVMTALRKEPQRRYPSVEALAEDIRRHREGLPITARKGTLPYRAGKYVRRHGVGVTAAAALLVLLASLAVTMTVQSARLARERDKAEKVSAFLVDLFSVSDPSEAKGNTVTAREILDKGAAKIAGELKEQPDVKATLMDTMSRVYSALGLYDRARPLAEDALNLRRQALGSQNLEVAASLQSLAGVLDQKGDSAAAEGLHREALAIHRKLLGNEHPEVARSLTALANTLEDKGDYAGAESLHREALAIQRKVLGSEHLDVARTLHGLANLSYRKGDYAGAEALYRESLAMRRKLLGNEDRGVARSIHSLANVLDEREDYAGAEALIREALALHRKLLGNDHPDVARSVLTLAIVLDHEGNYAESETLHREALAMHRKLVGNEHPNVAENLNYLGIALDHKGDYIGAESAQREALAVWRKLLGNENPGVAETLNNLAAVLDHKKDYAGAESVAHEALALRRKIVGDSHPYVAESLATLGQILRDRSRLPESEKAFRESLEIRRSALPPEHPDITASLIGLGDVLAAEGQAAQAETLLRQGLETREKKLPRDHPKVAQAQSALGSALTRSRKFDEAEPLLLAGYKVLASKQPASVAAQDARRHLLDLYSAWNKPDKAAAYGAP